MVKPTSLIWTRMPASAPRRRMAYAKIAAAAVALADRGGLEEVTIRNLARRLESGAMSLYRYVSNKDDLWDLMLDAAFGEIQLPPNRTTNWRREVLRVGSAR